MWCVSVASRGHTERSRPVEKRRGGALFGFVRVAGLGLRLESGSLVAFVPSFPWTSRRKRTDSGTSVKKTPRAEGRPCAHSAKRRLRRRRLSRALHYVSPPIRTFVSRVLRQRTCRAARSQRLVWFGSPLEPHSTIQEQVELNK